MISKQEIKAFEERHRILLRANEFICVLPHPCLREYIASYNITFPTKDLMSERFCVIPCGCATISIEKSSSNLFVFLQGPVTKPYVIGNQGNLLEMIVTIEFKPAGLFALTGITQSELADQTLPFGLVNALLSKMISETIEQAESVCQMVTGLDLLLLAKVQPVYCPELTQTIHRIYQYTGNIAVKNLSDHIYYSERQLGRIFQQYVGTSAKSFSRLIRINHSFQLLKNPQYSLTFVSDTAGFHDLPHFIRDFKHVCGVTPGTCRDNMSDFYSNPTRF